MTDLPDHLERIADAIKDVYPLGVAGDPYLCLLRVLDEELDDLDDDEVARIIAACFEMEYEWTLRDVRRVRDIEGLDQEQCDDIRDLLAESGLDL